MSIIRAVASETMSMNSLVLSGPWISSREETILWRTSSSKRYTSRTSSVSSRYALRPSSWSLILRTMPRSTSLLTLTVAVGLVTHAASASLDRVQPSISEIVSSKGITNYGTIGSGDGILGLATSLLRLRFRDRL